MMYCFWGFVFGWVKRRTAWVLIGLVLLSLLIWIVGPLVAIGTWTPLVSVLARCVLIGLVFLIYLVRRLVGAWRAGAINLKVFGALTEAREAKPSDVAEASQFDARALRGRFQEALSVLKKARFDPEASSGRVSRLFARRQYVYQLPWYVIIGAPGSGKTTVLAHSGLNFPLAGLMGNNAVKGVGGTRDCDWWFTDQAVLLDTAGRYTTHESDRARDNSEWQGFLALLKKFRPRQPINGVLVSLSVQDLLGDSDEARQRYAQHLRARLDELRTELGVVFPVYFLVTKCDLLAGFSEFFAGLDKHGRSQVWGFTLPLGDQGKDGSLRLVLQQEFRLLQGRLQDRLIEVLEKSNDLVRRALCYSFPQQFEGMRDVLTDFVEALGFESRYQLGVQVRGVYFTSGTQEGAPFDRVLSGLDATFHAQLPAQAKRQGAGASFFIHDMLQRVVFPEAHLAGANRAQDARLRRWRYAGYTASLVLMLAAVVAWGVSFRNNAAYIVEVDAKADRLRADVAGMARFDVDGLLALLPLLTRSAEVVDSAGFAHDAPPLGWTFGLYQGEKLHAAGEVVYQSMLSQRFTPALDARLAHLLRSMDIADLEFAFETLRAYLMLHDPQRYEGREFSMLMLADWDLNMPGGSGGVERGAYARHLAKLVRIDDAVAGGVADLALVKDTRLRLSQYSLAQRVYSRLRRKLWDNALPEFSVARVAGAQGASVLKRRSGKPLTEGVPSLYSYRGYHELFAPEVDAAIRLIGDDDAWVLGGALRPSTEVRRDQFAGVLAVEVKTLYMRDYVAAWEQFLGDVGLVRSDSLLDSVQLAKTLGAPDSPLSLLVKAAAKETTLLQESGADQNRGSLLERMKSSARATQDDLTRMVGPSVMPGQFQPRDKPEWLVDKHFEGLRRMAVGSGSGGAPIETVVQAMNEFYAYLAASEATVRAGGRPPVGDVAVKLKTQAGQLPQPLRQVVEELAVAGESHVTQQVRVSKGEEMVGEVTRLCQQTIAGRYPFARGAAKDVMPEDFARMFGPGGKFDEYFRRNLGEMVDRSTHPWSLKDGARGRMGGSAGIAAFEQAQTIREVFFRGGAGVPRLSLTLKPVEMDQSITSFTLDVDGQVVRYQHGPSVAQTIVWPGPRGSQQVRVMLEPTASSGVSGELKEGPWALHRLFDAARIAPGPSPEKFLVTLLVGGRQVQLEATASSVQNPFRMKELASFHCPSSL